MTITDKTRKKLWAKSGNRCAICKKELFFNIKMEEDANIGEECHIISSKSNGPRHKAGILDYDTYDNLILLCRNHHKIIDELTDTYTEEVLRYFKLNHENFINSSLNSAFENENKNTPKFLTRITSGKELFRIISGAHAFETDYDEIDNKEKIDFIALVFQTLQDWGDIGNELESYDQIQAGYTLNSLINELDEKGFYIFGERKLKKIKFSNGSKDDWEIATLIIKSKDSSEIIFK